MGGDLTSGAGTSAGKCADLGAAAVLWTSLLDYFHSTVRSEGRMVKQSLNKRTSY